MKSTGIVCAALATAIGTLLGGCGSATTSAPPQAKGAEPTPIPASLDGAIYVTLANEGVVESGVRARCTSSEAAKIRENVLKPAGFTFRCLVGRKRTFPYAVQVTDGGDFSGSMLKAGRAANEMRLTDHIEGTGVALASGGFTASPYLNVYCRRSRPATCETIHVAIQSMHLDGHRHGAEALDVRVGGMPVDMRKLPRDKGHAHSWAGSLRSGQLTERRPVQAGDPMLTVEARATFADGSHGTYLQAVPVAGLLGAWKRD